MGASGSGGASGGGGGVTGSDGLFDLGGTVEGLLRGMVVGAEAVVAEMVRIVDKIVISSYSTMNAMNVSCFCCPPSSPSQPEDWESPNRLS